MFKRYLYFVLVLLLSLLFFILWVYISPPPVYPTKKTIKIPHITIDISEGKRLAQTICVRCHYNFQSGTLSGRMHGNPKRLGYFFSGNITQDTITGIGKWTNEELYYFFRTGVKPNGQYVFDMPKYPNLSEYDLLSLIAFLKSDDSLILPVRNYNPPPKYSFLTKGLLRFVLRPVEWDSTIIDEPDTTDILSWGKYLATSKFSCFVCHSGNMVTNNYKFPERSWRYFEGGNPHADEKKNRIYSSNLTPDTLSGIGAWSRQEFVRTVKAGVKPDGKVVRDPMFPFYLLTDDEISAIYAYLMSLPPIKNKY